jgi:hypothetical protein
MQVGKAFHPLFPDPGQNITKSFRCERLQDERHTLSFDRLPQLD